MQTTKLRSISNLVTINKEFIRTVAVATAAEESYTNLKSWREIPGPTSLPIIGQLHHFLPGGALQVLKNANGTMKLYEKYGPIVRLDAMLNRSTTIYLFDPKSVEQIFRSENLMPLRPEFESLEYYRKDLKKSKGHKIHATGLITDQGELWQEFRSTVNPVMLQPKTLKLYGSLLDEVAQDMVARMKANRDEKTMIRNQFDREMNLWSLESMSTIAFGCRMNCFDSSLPKDSIEWQLIQCYQELFTTTYNLDVQLSLWTYFSTPSFKKAMKLYEYHEKLTEQFLKKGMAQLHKNSNTEKGVLAKLLEINEEVAHIMGSDMLLAGVNTIANTMKGILYFLGTNLERQDKLRQEIMSNSERRPYLKACVKESLRLLPVVSGNLRQTTKEYNILGYKIPKHMHVFCASHDMSVMEKNYPRAREFIPERWIAQKDDPLSYVNAHPFAYIPFGYGARSCIGRRIAEVEMETFTARLIENFRVEWFGPPPKIVQTSLNYITGPYNFIFRDV